MKIVQARRIKSLKLGFTNRQVPIFRTLNREKALVAFTYCYEKRMDLEDPVDAVSGGRGFRGTFPLSQPDAAIIVFRLS